jgi:acyl carrier protein
MLASALKAIVARVKKNDEVARTIDESTDLLNDVGLDSVEITDFILRVEEELQVEIDYERLERHHLRTLGAFAEYIRQLPRA